MIGSFIEGLDSWVVKTVMGRGEVNLLIEQMKQMRKQAPKMLDEAIGELKAMWNKALGDKLPTSTAHGTPAKSQQGSTTRPGVIGETKSSLLGAFAFLQALPEDIRTQLSKLSADEGSNPTPATASGDKPVPNIFENDKRDGVSARTKVDAATADFNSALRPVGSHGDGQAKAPPRTESRAPS